MSTRVTELRLTLPAAAVLFALGATAAVAQQQSDSQRSEGSQQQSQQPDQRQDSAAQRHEQDGAQRQGAAEDRAQSAQPNPYLRGDDSWITLSGTVENVGPNSFVLSYGDGRITVEMDDDDRDADGYALRNGDKVSVFGAIDADLFERTTIEASSVYVEKLGTYFFASAADEEDVPVVIGVAPTDPSVTSIVGTVTEVNGDEFTLDRGVRSIRVEVENMAYDPLDEEGYQRIEVGDVVSVSGNLDNDFFEGRELEARSIVTLFDHPG